MNFLPRPLHILSSIAMIACLASCAVMQKDSPNAAITVHATSTDDVQTAAVEAFENSGFRWISTSGDEVIFERPLNGTDEVLYGTWGDEKSTEHVVVRVTPVGIGAFNVACFPYIIRNPKSGMEDVSRRFSVYSKTYSGALHELRRTLGRG